MDWEQMILEELDLYEVTTILPLAVILVDVGCRPTS